MSEAIYVNLQRNLAVKEIYDWLSTLRKRGRLSRDLSSEIAEELNAENDPCDRRILKSILADELGRHGRAPEAEAIYRELNKEEPDDALTLMSLARLISNQSDRVDDALLATDAAIDAAFRSGNFRRDALGAKIRMALGIQRYDLVEGAMRRILPLRTLRGHIDCAIEGDFLKWIPAGAIDEEVRRQYTELVRAQQEWVKEREQRDAPST